MTTRSERSPSGRPLNESRVDLLYLFGAPVLAGALLYACLWAVGFIGPLEVSRTIALPVALVLCIALVIRQYLFQRKRKIEAAEATD